MYKKLILGLCLVAGSVCAVASDSSKICQDSLVINTQGNAVGIAEDDICYLQPDKTTIRCASGTVIKNPIQRQSALTGTPGFLSGQGYIGYLVVKPSTPSMMGSGKRIDFYRR
jgi:hypothetical protein